MTAIAFVVAFMVGCVLALWRHPIFGLLTYVGTFYLHPPSRWWGQGFLLDIRWSLMAAAVTVVALAVRRHQAQELALFRHKIVWGMLAFLVWILIQSSWVLAMDQHRLLISYYLKYMVVVLLVYKCVDSEKNLRLFLWSHVLGCFYFGWIAFTSYAGGRFEGFGGPGINEANAAALTMATGVLFGGSLFLAGTWRHKAILIAVIAILINGIVTTISRSGFLAMAVGGIVYNIFTPSRFSKRVRIFSILAVVMFALLTNPVYWARIQSIKYTGETVEGVDTGSGRLVIIETQLRMAKDHPLGCGHFCTDALSPAYFAESDLSRGTGQRSSHNTFMSLLVDQGIVGAVFYVLMLLWILGALRALARQFRNKLSFQATLLPAMAASFGAMTVGDMFVSYVRYEVRFWLIGLLMALLSLAARERRGEVRATADERVIQPSHRPMAGN